MQQPRLAEFELVDHILLLMLSLLGLHKIFCEVYMIVLRCIQEVAILSLVKYCKKQPVTHDQSKYINHIFNDNY